MINFPSKQAEFLRNNILGHSSREKSRVWNRFHSQELHRGVKTALHPEIHLLGIPFLLAPAQTLVRRKGSVISFPSAAPPVPVVLCCQERQIPDPSGVATTSSHCWSKEGWGWWAMQRAAKASPPPLPLPAVHEAVGAAIPSGLNMPSN